MQGFALLLSALSLSPDVAPASVVSPAEKLGASCELHIWPAPGPETMTEGFWNHVRNQALRDGAVDSYILDAIGRQGQSDSLASLDFANMLKVASVNVVIHSDSPPSSAPGTEVVRHVSSDAGCYAELVVRRLVYASNALSGRALQAFFVYREFGTGNAPVYSFTSMAEAPLLPSSGKKSEEKDDARAGLSKAYRGDVVLFFRYFDKFKAKRSSN